MVISRHGSGAHDVTCVPSTFRRGTLGFRANLGYLRGRRVPRSAAAADRVFVVVTQKTVLVCGDCVIFGYHMVVFAPVSLWFRTLVGDRIVSGCVVGLISGDVSMLDATTRFDQLGPCLSCASHSRTKSMRSGKCSASSIATTVATAEIR